MVTQFRKAAVRRNSTGGADTDSVQDRYRAVATERRLSGRHVSTSMFFHPSLSSSSVPDLEPRPGPNRARNNSRRDALISMNSPASNPASPTSPSLRSKSEIYVSRTSSDSAKHRIHINLDPSDPVDTAAAKVDIDLRDVTAESGSDSGDSDSGDDLPKGFKDKPHTPDVKLKRMQAVMFVRDAGNNMTIHYYLGPADSGEEVPAQCVWETDAFGVRAAALFRRNGGRRVLKMTALFLMACSLLDSPTRMGSEARHVGFGLSSVGLLVFWGYFVVSVRCMWRFRQHMWKCGEGPWIVLLGISLLVSTVGHFGGLVDALSNNVDTIYGDLQVDDVMLSVCVENCLSMRPAVMSAFIIFTRLGAMGALIGVSFVCHYFAIKAATPEGSIQEQKFFFSSEEGVWNMFVLLTTANHPDVLMPLFHDNPVAAGLLMISFMVVTFYFLMNLLLGVVFTEYQSLMSEKLLDQNRLKRAMLYSAYLELRSVVPGEQEGLSKDDLMWVMSRYGDGKGKDPDRVELWWQLLDADGSGTLEFDEFSTIHRTVHAPIERIPPVLSETYMDPIFPTIHKFLYKSSLVTCFCRSSSDDITENPENYSSCMKLMHALNFTSFLEIVTVLSVFWGLATSTEHVCEQSSFVAIEVMFTVLFLLDVVLRSLGEMRQGVKLYYFTDPYSWLDLLSTGLMALGVSSCYTGKPDAAQELRSMVGIVRAIRCFRLTHSIAPLRKICFCATSMVSLVMPQATLFCTVYYCYAVAGMGLFAGDTTKTVAAGGPGKWDTLPWSSSQYGQACGHNGYYYDLNFDTIGNSLVTLFVCMVQNNWYVVVDGFVQTNTGYARLFFLSFNVMVVIIMMNLFVATVLSLYDILQSSSNDTGESDAVKREYKQLEQRLEQTPFKNSWRVKPRLKDNSILFSKGSGEDDVLCNELLDQMAENKQTNAILNWCPSPIFIQSPNGLYIFCNTVYAAMLGTTPESMVDTYDEQSKLKQQRCEWRLKVLTKGAAEKAAAEAAGAAAEQSGHKPEAIMYRGNSVLNEDSLDTTAKLHSVCREKIWDVVAGKYRIFLAHSRPIELLTGGNGVITYLHELHPQEYMNEMNKKASVVTVRYAMVALMRGCIAACIDTWRTQQLFTTSPRSSRPSQAEPQFYSPHDVSVIFDSPEEEPEHVQPPLKQVIEEPNVLVDSDDSDPNGLGTWLSPHPSPSVPRTPRTSHHEPQSQQREPPSAELDEADSEQPKLRLTKSDIDRDFWNYQE